VSQPLFQHHIQVIDVYLKALEAAEREIIEMSLPRDFGVLLGKIPVKDGSETNLLGHLVDEGDGIWAFEPLLEGSS